MKLNWNFLGWGGGAGGGGGWSSAKPKKLLCGGVWIFSGTTNNTHSVSKNITLHCVNGILPTELTCRRQWTYTLIVVC